MKSSDIFSTMPSRILLRCIPIAKTTSAVAAGGGQLSITRFAKRRIEAGKIKAEQIRITGAKVVATPCHNCVDQLSELNKEYKLGVEIKTIAEIVSDALVLNP